MMRPFPLAGNRLNFGSPSITAQERVNCYIEQSTDSGDVTIFRSPGLDLFATASGVVRGVFGINDSLIVAIGSNIYSYDNSGLATLVGYLTTITGRVDIANNGAQTLLVDGTDQARLIDTVAATSIYVTLPCNADSCCFLDSYFIVNDSNTQQFFISGQYDGATWDVLDFASSESNPDNLLRVFADHGQLMLFGAFTVEIWGNNGAQDFPFQRVATPTEWGLAAIWSVAKLDNAVAFLGRNRLGQAQVVMMTGYTVQKISTEDVDRIINDNLSYSSATAYSYMANGHSMYVLNVGGKTLMFDLLSNEWSTLKSYGIERHRGEIGTNYLERTVVSDYSNGKIYNVDDHVFDDDGDPSIVTITGRHMTKNRELMILRELEIDMEHGVGLATGQGSDPQMMISISRDGGHNFSAVRNRAIGAVGEYQTRTRLNRLGQGRDFVFKISISDPIPVSIIGAYVRAE